MLNLTNISKDDYEKYKNEIEQEYKRIKDVFTYLIVTTPILGYCISNWRNIYPTLSVETMATSMDSLYFNPLFTKELTYSELRGVVLHEVFHVLYLHPLDKRLMIRSLSSYLLRLAEEQVVNESVLKLKNSKKDDKISLPGKPVSPLDVINLKLSQNLNKKKEPIYIYSKELEDKNTSEIYTILYNKVSTEIKNNPRFLKSLEMILENILTEDIIIQESSTSQISDSQYESKSITILSELKGKHGFISLEANRIINSLSEPKIPWKRVLQAFFKSRVRDKIIQTTSKFRGKTYYALKRYNYILPSQKKESSDKLKDVVIAVDTSGSITDSQLTEFFSEIKEILSNYVDTVKLIQIDCQILSVKDVSIEDLEKIEIKGGGGTDFRPVFKYIRDENINPECLIFFTDGYGEFPHEEPEYKTFFVINNTSITSPVGTTLRLV